MVSTESIRLSIIIPTIGRDSLARTLDSFYHQLAPKDEVIVISDGPSANAAHICYKYPRITFVEGEENHMVGHPQRNQAMPFATGSHLMSIDDDDIYVPGALDKVRAAIGLYPDSPLLFQFIDKNGAIIGSDQQFRVGHIGTPSIVAPNDPTRLGVWGYRYEGDYDFIWSTIFNWGNHKVWISEVIVDCRR